MPSLSVIMIVKNEAGCLADCLASVRSIADEIAIADTGSTDSTVAIARQFGARCESIEWHNDFAAARNHSIAMASGDWLLHLDADEVLDETGARRIRRVVDEDGAGADAVEVILANYCDEMRAWRWIAAPADDPMAKGYSGFIAVPLLRLFRNRKGYHYSEPVHENITESVQKLGGRIRSEPVLIHHYGYAKPNADKARLYLAIAREKAASRPNDAKAWHDLSEQLLALNETEEAAAAARKALLLEPNHMAAATTLATICLNTGRLDEAQSILTAIVEKGPPPSHVLTALAAIACKQGRIKEARTHIDAAIATDSRSVMGHLYRARILDIQGETVEASKELQAAATLAPSLDEVRSRVHAHALRIDAGAQSTAGDLAGALATYVAALKLDAEDPLTHMGIGYVSRRLGQFDSAQRCFERANALCPAALKNEANS